MKRWGLISVFSVVLVVSLFLARSVISVEPLMVAPSSLDLTIASGRLDTAYLVVFNPSDSSMSVESDFDDKWMLISPSKFKIPSKEGRRVLAIFFIPREENPQREGEIVFRAKDNKSQAKVKVVISAPKIMPVAAEKETRIEELEREIRAKSEKIEQLKKEIEEMKFSYEGIVGNLRNEKELLQSELQEKELQIAGLSKSPDEKRIEEMQLLYELLAKNLTEELKKNEVQLAWLGNKLSITISGLVVFDSGKIYPKKEGSLILEKIGYILKGEANFAKQIVIKGHTDAFPIGSYLKNKFPSNWELSAARAATIVRILQQRIGIDGKCLTAASYSSYSPLASNEDWQGRAENRRIEIVVSSLKFEKEGK